MPLVNMESRSRKLAYLLRHDCGYRYETGGWRLVSDLIDNHSFTSEEIEVIVSTDVKGRFELNEDKTKVRALYGHSVEIELMLHSQCPPEFLYHGTASKYLSSIKHSGLLPKARQYVHLTEDIEAAAMTGSRHGDPIVLKVLSHLMCSEGYVFHRLDNGVWLTKEVPIEYIDIIKN